MRLVPNQYYYYYDRQSASLIGGDDDGGGHRHRNGWAEEEWGRRSRRPGAGAPPSSSSDDEVSGTVFGVLACMLFLALLLLALSYPGSAYYYSHYDDRHAPPPAYAASCLITIILSHGSSSSGGQRCRPTPSTAATFWYGASGPRPCIVDTPFAASRACVALRGQRVLAIDLEGAPLGTRISLLQIAIPPPPPPPPPSSIIAAGGTATRQVPRVFLFDVLALGQTLFDSAHLRPLLSDPTVLKLCYDCRGDGSALLLQHGVRLRGAYDLQIVFTSLFQCAVADPFLKGLHRAVEFIAPPRVSQAFGERKRAAKRIWGTQGPAATALQRPLTKEAISYAADDVTPLLEMHRVWSTLISERAVVAASAGRLQRHLWQQQQPQQPPMMCRVDFNLVRAHHRAVVTMPSASSSSA